MTASLTELIIYVRVVSNIWFKKKPLSPCSLQHVSVLLQPGQQAGIDLILQVVQFAKKLALNSF